MQINIRMVKRAILDPLSSYSLYQNIVHSANHNLASNYDRNIILSPFLSQCSPLSYCVKTSISEFPTYASFGGGGSQIGV